MNLRMPHPTQHWVSLQTRHWLMLSVVFVCALWHSSGWTEVLTVQRDMSQIDPLWAIETLEDSGGTLDLKDILLPATQAKFVRRTGNYQGALNFGFTKATYWIKLTLKRTPDATNDWILEIPYLNLNALTLYAPGLSPVEVGTDFSSNNKPLFYPLYALPIQLTTEPQTFYLKVKSEYAITVPIMLWTRTAFSREYSNNLLTQALYFGGLLSLALYNFLLYLSLKDRCYIYYTLFALTMGMGAFAGNGYARLYLWPEAATWDTVSQATIYSLAGTLSLWFSRTFLRTRDSFPRINRSLNGLALAYLLTSSMFVWSIESGFSPSLLFQIFLAITLPAGIITFLAGILVYRTGNKSALYFLFAYSALWAGALVGALRAFDMVPSNGVTLYALQIGSSLEMLLLSFTLAYRIHSERDQRIAAQDAVIEARNDLLKLAKENESQLEKKVIERTEKLQEIALNEQQIRQQYTRFGAMIAHEFRNPLGIIETQSTLMKRENQLGIDKVVDRVETIKSASHRLSSLFDQWLKSDQLQQPISQVHAVPIELQALMTPVIQGARGYHRDRKIEVESVPKVTLNGDQGLLEIALMNLIDNACKYSPADTPVSIGFRFSENRVGITITDHGPGMPPEQCEAIFKAYVRFSNSTNKPGFGLGLAFVAHIVERHHGRVEVISQPGEGSQFCLWIPCSH